MPEEFFDLEEIPFEMAPRQPVDMNHEVDLIIQEYSAEI